MCCNYRREVDSKHWYRKETEIINTHTHTHTQYSSLLEGNTGLILETHHTAPGHCPPDPTRTHAHKHTYTDTMFNHQVPVVYIVTYTQQQDYPTVM